MGAAASAGRSAGYGIGVVGGRGKAGTIEFGKSVITDDDAFQSSQRDPHRKSGKASSRSPKSGADDTKSSKVIERRRRSNTPPQVKKTIVQPPAGAGVGVEGTIKASTAAGSASDASGTGRRPSMKEKVENFFIRGKSIKATSLLPLAIETERAEQSANDSGHSNSPVTSLVYTASPHAADGAAGTARTIPACNLNDPNERSACGNQASTTGKEVPAPREDALRGSTCAATSAKTSVSLGRSFRGAAINNTSDRDFRLSGDHCIIHGEPGGVQKGATDAHGTTEQRQGVGTSYFLCRLRQANPLWSKLQTCTSVQSPGKKTSFTRGLQSSSPIGAKKGSGSPRQQTAVAGAKVAQMEGGGSSCYINVGPSGFKFFRPTPPKQAASGGAAAFPFAHFALDKIHSWSFLEKNAFSFKFFEVAEKRLVEFAFTVPSMELLRQELSNTIAGLVAGRQSKAISEASFSALVDGLAKSHDSSRTELIRASLGEVYINAKQGSLLLELIEDDFDQCEVLVYLHSRMLNQNTFYQVIESLDTHMCENIWHKILNRP